MPVATMFESDAQIERPLRNLTRTNGDHARMLFTLRNSHGTLVLVSWKEFNHAGRINRIEQDLMDRRRRRDSLIIAIAAGMIVRPGDIFCLLIVAHVSRFVGIRMSCVEEMGPADTSKCT